MAVLSVLADVTAVPNLEAIRRDNLLGYVMAAHFDSVRIHGAGPLAAEMLILASDVVNDAPYLAAS